MPKTTQEVVFTSEGRQGYELAAVMDSTFKGLI